MLKRVKLFSGGVLFCIGIGLTLCNLYGLTQEIRPSDFSEQDLRFKNDVSLNEAQVTANLGRYAGESNLGYAKRMTQVISNGLAHIHWYKYDHTKFNQLIPVWENYFLYFMGRFSGIPEYERYHYTHYQRSLKRGIGICGDAAMVLSQVLELEGIDNQIIAFPEHVIVSATFEDGIERSFDPDFGVVIGHTPDQIKAEPTRVNTLYLNAGHPEKDVLTLNTLYKTDFTRWNGVTHFVTKKYYFENITYWLKWPLPILMMYLGVSLIRIKK